MTTRNIRLDNNKAPGYYAGELRDGALAYGTVDKVSITLRWFPYGGTFTALLKGPGSDDIKVVDLTMEDMGDRVRDLVPRLLSR